MREKKKNKKNDKKKGKVRIIAGVMTREEDSDSTVSPGGGDKRQECLPLNNPTGGGDTRDHSHGEHFPKTMMSPQEAICSFCGVAMHSHKDCPVMHQYIREQADALVQKRLEEYHQLQVWAAYESAKGVPFRHNPQ